MQQQCREKRRVLSARVHQEARVGPSPDSNSRCVDGLKKHDCPHCDLSSVRKNMLKLKHVETGHNYIKSYMCLHYQYRADQIGMHSAITDRHII